MSPVARQMTSNTIVAMRDIVQMCFVGFSIQIDRAAVAESVALFTHCRAIQLSECCQPNRTHARIKNCKFLARTSQNHFFSQLTRIMYGCEYIARLGVTNLASSPSILKHCCSLCEA